MASWRTVWPNRTFVADGVDPMLRPLLALPLDATSSCELVDSEREEPRTSGGGRHDPPGE